MINIRTILIYSFLFCAILTVTTTRAKTDTLRLLTWGGYAPKELVKKFENETGIKVKVTKSNNEEMIAKLRATRGAGFDLAQPSQDRIQGAQTAFKIYQPIDLTKIDNHLFNQSIYTKTIENTKINGKTYGIPHVWGTSGLIVNTSKAEQVKDYDDLCLSTFTGKVSYRLKRPTLIGFAFSIGEDPFTAYHDKAAYQAVLDKVEDKLIQCKQHVKTYWSGADALINLIRSGEVVAAMGWDTGAWNLSNEMSEISYVVPESGALGWVDTFAIPRKAKNIEAAYQWINFMMRAENAAVVTNTAGNFTAAEGANLFVNEQLQRHYKNTFTEQALNNIKWYPPVPEGLEHMEGKVLDKVKAATS